MDSIQFGEIQESQPESELRPDENAQFATRIVGKLGADELPIFVDLDVMRDMEAHAVSNTRVELGGVMLGRQSVDSTGNPFVLISESLRAEHYFATKGSFTFTHDTWSEITRRRAEFHPGLQMVGWYHTHPGWNVFLSGMDLFICDNFFNRPLDVALVIDPVNDDRGWFQWENDDTDGESTKRTERTGGFVLVAGRHRKAELEYFANLYEKNGMNKDPRYSGHAGGQTIQVVDSKRPTDLILLSMLAMQLIFMATIVYWLTTANTASNTNAVADQQAESVRQKAQAELLSLVVAGQTGDQQFADEFTKLKEQEYLLRENLEGQLARVENESRLRQQTEKELRSASIAGERYAGELARLKQKLAKAEGQLTKLSGEDVDGEAVADSTYGWIWWLGAGLGLLSVGGVGGYAWKASERPPRRQIASANGVDSIQEFDAGEDHDADYEDPVVPTRVG